MIRTPKKFNKIGDKMSTKRIIGIILTVLGGVGILYCIMTILEDTSGWLFRYTYAPPFTDHEITVISILVVAIISTISGIIMLCNKEHNY